MCKPSSSTTKRCNPALHPLRLLGSLPAWSLPTRGIAAARATPTTTTRLPSAVAVAHPPLASRLQTCWPASATPRRALRKGRGQPPQQIRRTGTVDQIRGTEATSRQCARTLSSKHRRVEGRHRRMEVRPWGSREEEQPRREPARKASLSQGARMPAVLGTCRLPRQVLRLAAGAPAARGAAKVASPLQEQRKALVPTARVSSNSCECMLVLRLLVQWKQGQTRPVELLGACAPGLGRPIRLRCSCQVDRSCDIKRLSHEACLVA